MEVTDNIQGEKRQMKTRLLQLDALTEVGCFLAGEKCNNFGEKSE